MGLEVFHLFSVPNSSKWSLKGCRLVKLRGKQHFALPVSRSVVQVGKVVLC